MNHDNRLTGQRYSKPLNSDSSTIAIHIYKHSILAHTHGRQSDLRPLRVGPDLRVCLKAVEETSMTGLCSHQVMPYNLHISSH